MWFRRKKSKIPEGIWKKCEHCKEILFRKDIENNLFVCPKCNYHFKIEPKKRLELLYDNGKYEIFDENIFSVDPLNFKDLKKYKDRLKENIEKTNLTEALINTEGKIEGFSVILSLLDFSFMGGSMGSVVGEKLTKAIEKAIREKKPFIAITSSGGARMQEGVISLMQMAKTAAAVAKLHEEKIPYISILTHPTTGGVCASFAMLGDVIIAEPKALIGFAGPRVIEQTIGQKLPEGFQRAEFLLEHGLIDMVVERKNLKKTIGLILSFFTKR